MELEEQYAHSASIPRLHAWALALMILLVTSINLFKPFHIDDPFHVTAARWITEHPLRPMSGTIDWSGSLEHFYDGNQPPLFFYGMALWAMLFGFEEVAMHSFEALFSALAIVMFYRTARMLASKSALVLTGLLALGPAFIVNQNVMLDVPLLGLIITFLYFACKALLRGHARSLLWASLFLSIGCLIKYTMLALFPALVLAVVFTGKRTWWVPFVPVVLLGAWSLWNVHEFGYMHLFARKLDGAHAEGSIHRLLSYAMTLGAIAPWLFFHVLASLGVTHKRLLFLGGVAMVSIGLFIACAWCGWLDQHLVDTLLVALFTINGSSCALLVWKLRTRGSISIVGPAGKIRMVIIVAALSLAVFVVLFAPWMATRQVLLVLPMLLLGLNEGWDQLPVHLSRTLMIGTTALGVLLGISDLRYARFYREKATVIAAERCEGRRWFTGSMGWGWYAAEAGLLDISASSSKPEHGDLIAVPFAFSVPDLPKQLHATEVEWFRQRIGPLDRFSTRQWVRFYSAGFPGPPWNISQGQPERIQLLAVE